MAVKINKIWQHSQGVILNCVLPNGAIVAANSTEPHYCSAAKNYFFVWPRDAAFVCMAADVLGMKEVGDNFFQWAAKKVGSWRQEGIFYANYYPNGLEALNYCQPDQTGIFLVALAHHLESFNLPAEKYRPLLKHSADGLCALWQKDRFKKEVQDLWEERFCFPDVQENFLYSLAACSAGLKKAAKILNNRRYLQVSQQMRRQIMQSGKKLGYFARSGGEFADPRIDASILGLVWPFQIVKPLDSLMLRTVDLIEKKLVRHWGVYRYEGDEYDGWMYRDMHRKKGAGFWPLLNFWLAIVLSRQGKKAKARRYFNQAIKNIELDIPEQIFANSYQKSVSPLAWSHAMFLFACRELELK